MYIPNDIAGLCVHYYPNDDTTPTPWEKYLGDIISNSKLETMKAKQLICQRLDQVVATPDRFNQFETQRMRKSITTSDCMKINSEKYETSVVKILDMISTFKQSNMNEKIEKVVNKIRNNNNETSTDNTIDGDRLFKFKNQEPLVIVYEFDTVQLHAVHEKIMITILNQSNLHGDNKNRHQFVAMRTIIYLRHSYLNRIQTKENKCCQDETKTKKKTKTGQDTYDYPCAKDCCFVRIVSLCSIVYTNNIMCL